MATTARSPGLYVLVIALATVVACGICPPFPSITSISPVSATAGGNQFILTVNGNDFRRDSVVSWNTSFLVTGFVSSHQLAAVVPATDIAQPGAVLVSVFNPPRRHDLCLRWHRSSVHNLLQRQELKCRFLYDQPVIAWEPSLSLDISRCKRINEVTQSRSGEGDKSFGAAEIAKQLEAMEQKRRTEIVLVEITPEEVGSLRD